MPSALEKTTVDSTLVLLLCCLSPSCVLHIPGGYKLVTALFQTKEIVLLLMSFHFARQENCSSPANWHAGSVVNSRIKVDLRDLAWAAWSSDGVPVHCRGVGLGGLQRSLPTLRMLWFYTGQEVALKKRSRLQSQDCLCFLPLRVACMCRCSASIWKKMAVFHEQFTISGNHLVKWPNNSHFYQWLIYTV